MGVFKISNKLPKRAAPMVNEEIFHTDIQADISRTLRTYRPTYWGFAFGGIAALLVAGLVGYWFFSGQGEDPAKAIVHFDIRAIDAGGHPVPGATVLYNRQTVGRTDSFGEWRRFIEIPVTGKMLITVEKDVEAARASRRGARRGAELSAKVRATRDFSERWARLEANQLEIAATLQLAAGTPPASTELAAVDPGAVPEASIGAPHARVSQVRARQEGDLKAAPYRAGSGSSRAGSGNSVKSWPDPRVGEGGLPALGGPGTRVAKDPGAGLDRISIAYHESGALRASAKDLRSAEILGGAVIDEMRQRAAQLGLKVGADAPWKVFVEHLPGSAEAELDGSAAEAGERPGLIMVTSVVPGSDRNLRFLKNYRKNPASTARSLLLGLRAHLPRPYRVEAEAGKVVLRQPKGIARFWKVRPGTVLFGESAGKRHSRVRVRVRSSSPEEGGRNNDIALGSVESQRVCIKLPCNLYSSHLGISPPAKGWKRLRLRLLGVNSGDYVFVSGYAADHDGGNIWSYWGRPGSMANLTVVSRGKVVFRKRIKSHQSLSPSGKLAKRPSKRSP